MPLTPVTAALFDTAYVQRQWSVLGSRLAPTGPPTDTPPAGPECSARPGMPLTSTHYTTYHTTLPYLLHRIIVCICIGCAALGLLGLCCPNPDGVMLSCCSPGNGNGGAQGMNDEWKSYIIAIHAGLC